ncbi:MAG: hypothetical protein JNJ80_07285 [Gemmatimonadetes bacterium]|nr:hypothetical protein [Gemmatimonadota bacterium]MCC7132336.1 hypothetical protein [Gemmatimonadales bacterium]
MALPPLLRRWGSLAAIVVVATVVYANSFSSYPVLEQRHSVLGDADAAAFVPLVRDFELTRPAGDEYRVKGRTINDVAQKHKIHHLMYAAVAHGVYRGISAPLAAIGVSERAILYSVNALFGAASLILLWVLLGTVNPHRNARWPFVLLTAGSLSMWLYAAMPESWPFSGFLVLLTLLILVKSWLPWWGTAIWIGVAMLNNMTLAMLLVPLGMQLVAMDPRPGRVVARSVVASVLTFGVWLGSLWGLSFWEPDLRPDHFFGYLVWFRQFVGEPLPPLALYNWKIVISNLFFTPLVSNQADPYVPHDAIRLTFQQSGLGVVATLAVMVFLGMIAWRMVGMARQGLSGGGLPDLIRREPALMAAVYLLVDFVIILLMYPGAAFLYSAAIVALYSVMAIRAFDLRRRADLIVFGVTLALLLVNNTVQVLRFRAALAALPS